MAIVKQPFRNYTLDAEKDARYRLITIRLNAEEQAWLEEIKQDLNVQQDGKALKIAALAGKNVLQATFGRQFLKYLFSGSRSKLEE